MKKIRVNNISYSDGKWGVGVKKGDVLGTVILDFSGKSTIVDVTELMDAIKKVLR